MIPKIYSRVGVAWPYSFFISNNNFTVCRVKKRVKRQHLTWVSAIFSGNAFSQLLLWFKSPTALLLSALSVPQQLPLWQTHSPVSARVCVRARARAKCVCVSTRQAFLNLWITWNLFTKDIQILYRMLVISKYYVHYVCMYSFTRDSLCLLLLRVFWVQKKNDNRKFTVQMALISHWILGIVWCLQIWIDIYFVLV